MDELAIGTRCFANHMLGTIRFQGSTTFAPGLWVGVELDDPLGKNDGSINGERYFQCTDGHGVFLRSTKITLPSFEQLQEISMRRTDNRENPVPRSPMIARPERNRTPSKLSRPTSRVSLAEPFNKEQQSTDGESRLDEVPFQPFRRPVNKESAHNRDFRATPQRQSLNPRSRLGPAPPLSSKLEETPSQVVVNSIEVRDSSQLSVLEDTRAKELRSANVGASHAEDHGTSTEQKEELQATIQALERQRAEDLRKLSILDTLEAEKSAWLGIRSKLREKLQVQQSEIKELRSHIRDLQTQLDTRDATIDTTDDVPADANDVLEMAMLDREVAEEERDQLKLEVESMRQRVQDLELELELAKAIEANEHGTDMNFNADLAATEAQNARLREAVYKLKELTIEQDKTIESCTTRFEAVKNELLITKSQLVQANRSISELEMFVDDLKSQVDISTGAEEMLELLTVRNLNLAEDLERCKAELTDLLTLKEINDELEESHAQIQKELSQDLARKELLLAEQEAEISSHAERMVQYEQTVRTLRKLVETLRAQVLDLERADVDRDSHRAATAKESHELLSQNVSLRSVVRKAQLHKLTISICRLKTATVVLELDIMKEYMLHGQSYDQKSVSSYLACENMADICDVLASYYTLQIKECAQEYLENFVENISSLTELSVLCKDSARTILSSRSKTIQILEGSSEVLCMAQTSLLGLAHRLEADNCSEIDVREVVLETHASIRRLIDTHWQPLQTRMSPSGHAFAFIVLVLLLSKLLGQFILSPHGNNVQESEHATNDTRSVDIFVLCNALVSKVQYRYDEAKLMDHEINTGHADLSTYERGRECCKILLSIISVQLARLDTSDTLSRGTMATQLLQHMDKLGAKDALSEIDALLDKVAESMDAMPQSLEEVESIWALRAKVVRGQHSQNPDDTVKLETLRDEVRQLILKLNLKEKSLEEEQLRNQSLEKRIKEQASIVSHLKILEDREAILAAEQETNKNTIEKLDTELENLRRQALVPVAIAKAPDETVSSEILDRELRSLRKTIRYLGLQLEHKHISPAGQNLPDLRNLLDGSRSLPRTARSPELFSSIRSFCRDLTIVSLKEGSLTQTNWIPNREKCHYIHYLQEEQYANLLASAQYSLQQSQKS